VAIETLDFERERRIICDSMAEARRNLRVKFAHATTDRLRTMVTLGACAGLHYSGHGNPGSLMMEDGRGKGHRVHVEQLRKLLRAGGGTPSLRFVFVSACYSEAAAQAFIEAGVPHVIAVRLNTRVSDVAAQVFTRAFYLALAVGETLQAAYDIAVQAVTAAPGVPGGGAAEADKFLLLPHGDHHHIAPFRNLAAVECWEPPKPPEARHQQPLPALVEGFIGRNVEAAKVVAALLDRRLVSVTGHQGVGKSAVAIAALNYLAERHYFSDGVLYVDVAHVRSTAELARLLRSHTAPHAGSAAPPPRAVALASEQAGAELLAAASPLQGLHCLLVLDGLQPALASHPTFLELLASLLKWARVRTLLTASEPVAQPLHGGAEKVVQLERLSSELTARLLCRLSPRPLMLSEIAGASGAADFVQKLAAMRVVSLFEGNPGLVKAAAPHLQGHSLEDVEAMLDNGEIGLTRQASSLSCSSSQGSASSFDKLSSNFDKLDEMERRRDELERVERRRGSSSVASGRGSSDAHEGGANGGARHMPMIRRSVSGPPERTSIDLQL